MESLPLYLYKKIVFHLVESCWLLSPEGENGKCDAQDETGLAVRYLALASSFCDGAHVQTSSNPELLLWL